MFAGTLGKRGNAGYARTKTPCHPRDDRWSTQILFLESSSHEEYRKSRALTLSCTGEHCQESLGWVTVACTFQKKPTPSVLFVSSQRIQR